MREMGDDLAWSVRIGVKLASIFPQPIVAIEGLLAGAGGWPHVA
jgi:hypothetical protein